MCVCVLEKGEERECVYARERECTCVGVRESVSVRVCVCVCVREREREKEIRKQGTSQHTIISSHVPISQSFGSWIFDSRPRSHQHPTRPPLYSSTVTHTNLIR